MPCAPSKPFHVLAKPSGPLCNLKCEYCFYLKKHALFPGRATFRMSDEVLEAFVRSYIADQDAPEINFAWQGGEPTLLGLDFFRRALACQRRHAGGKIIHNAFQTNGTLLTAEWAKFLREEKFLVGISIDGPRELHDQFRQDKGGHGTFTRVMRGLKFLREAGVEYNLLTVVNAANAERPLELYRWLKTLGTAHLQFIPLVERAVAPGDDVASVPACAEATAASVTGAAYGKFLCAIFDEWARRDIGKIFIQDIESALSQRLGYGASVCVHAERCGRAVAIEHNGDVFSCDHYVYASHRLGNVRDTSLAQLVNSPAQQLFGQQKLTALPRQCRECPVLGYCNGGCPKHRFARTADGEPGLNFLCAGYRRFYAHIAPTLERLAQEHLRREALASSSMSSGAILGK
jgi:uncharacterized protein